jgi:hypothetical protein
MVNLLDRPRLLGLVCGVAAVALGLAYMAAGHAPRSYSMVNLGALALGSAIWLGITRPAASRMPGGGWAVVALAFAVLATALLGHPAAGASRWVTVGPLTIQASLIVLPAMIVLYSRSVDLVGTIGIALVSLALALQPDRAMAGVLTAGMAGQVLARPTRLGAMAFASALIGFGATLVMADISPAMPFVDRILYTAFDVHVLAGLAVMAGCAIVVAPALIVAVRAVENRHVLLAFGLSWAGVVAAAALGNYPTPLVGYSGSAILGYLLSAALLPAIVSDARKIEVLESLGHEHERHEIAVASEADDVAPARAPAI